MVITDRRKYSTTTGITQRVSIVEDMETINAYGTSTWKSHIRESFEVVLHGSLHGSAIATNNTESHAIHRLSSLQKPFTDAKLWIANFAISGSYSKFDWNTKR